MMDKLLFNRLAFVLLLALLASANSYAGGDDERDKKGKPIKNQATRADSIQFINDNIDLQEQDDTLVFEDWDSSDGDDEVSSIYVDLGTKPDKLSGNSTEALKEKKRSSLTDRFTSLKNEHLVDFTLYPNPTVSELYLKTTKTPNSFIITDLTGKQHILSYYSDVINVSHLSPGTYYIQLVYPDHLESSMFIKK
jgi:hypothetical protein